MTVLRVLDVWPPIKGWRTKGDVGRWHELTFVGLNCWQCEPQGNRHVLLAEDVLMQLTVDLVRIDEVDIRTAQVSDGLGKRVRHKDVFNLDVVLSLVVFGASS